MGTWVLGRTTETQIWGSFQLEHQVLKKLELRNLSNISIFIRRLPIFDIFDLLIFKKLMVNLKATKYSRSHSFTYP